MEKGEEKVNLKVFFYDCSCGVTFTSEKYEEVHGRATSHVLMFHTERVYRPDSRLMLRGL